MASVKYIKKLKQWQVRWHITDPVTKTIEKGSKLLPKNSTRYDAIRFAEQIESKERLIKIGFGRVTDNLQIAIDKWFSKIQQYTKRTRGHYETTIFYFAQSLPNHIRGISQIEHRHIQDYINGLLRQGRKNRTCNSQLTAIKSFLHFCSDYYNIPNPAAKISMLKEAPPIQRFLTDDEFRLIMNTDNPLFSDRAKFIANTGLRATEFCSLKWSDIHNHSLTVIGKGNKKRHIPLNSICLQILDRFKSENNPKIMDPIFLSKSTNPEDRDKTIAVTPNGLLLQCHRVAERIKIPLFGPHAFRHHFATSLLLAGKHISLVSKILGHSSIRTTEQIYIHILPEHLTGVTECLAAFFA